MNLLILRLKNWIVRKLGGHPRQNVYGKLIANNLTCGEIHDRELLSTFTKEELIDMLCGKSGGADQVHKYMMVKHELDRLHRLLKLDLGGQKELNRGLHIADLELKNKRLKEEVTSMRHKAEFFNDQLYATGLIVNCTGCWPGRPDKAEELTEEKVAAVENIATRLRTWWDNHVRRGNKVSEREFSNNT